MTNFMNQMIGGMGTFGMDSSEEEKKRAFQYAIRSLGQGLLKGAYSNQPGGVGMGLSEGLSNFGDVYRGGLETEQKKRIDQIKTQKALEMDDIQLKRGRQEIAENETKARDKKGKDKGYETLSSAFKDSLQQALEDVEASNNTPEYKALWKRKLQTAGAFSQQSLQNIDGQTTVNPDLLGKAMSIVDEYEKETGDTLLKENVLNRFDESASRYLGHTVKDEATGIERGDIDWIRKYRAEHEMTKDKLGIRQQRENIKATRALRDQREDPNTSGSGSSQDGVLPDATKMKMINDLASKYKTVAGGVFDHASGRFRSKDIQKLADELGILGSYGSNPGQSFNKFKQAFNQDPGAFVMKEWGQMESLFNQSNKTAPSQVAAPDPMKVQLGIQSGGVSKSDAIRDLQARGLNDTQIRAQYPFLF